MQFTEEDEQELRKTEKQEERARKQEQERIMREKAFAEASTMGVAPHMQIFVQLLGVGQHGRMIPLHASDKLTIGEVKTAVLSERGFEPDEYGLSYKEKVLDDASTLAHCHFKSEQPVLKVTCTMVKRRTILLEEMNSDEHLEGYEPSFVSKKGQRVLIGFTEIASGHKEDSDDEETVSQGSTRDSDSPSTSPTSRHSTRSSISCGSLKEHVASAHLQHQDMPGPSGRRASRRVSVEKAKVRQQERQTAQEPDALASVLWRLGNYMSSAMLAGCSSPCASAEQGIESNGIIKIKRQPYGRWSQDGWLLPDEDK